MKESPILAADVDTRSIDDWAHTALQAGGEAQHRATDIITAWPLRFSDEHTDPQNHTPGNHSWCSTRMMLHPGYDSARKLEAPHCEERTDVREILTDTQKSLNWLAGPHYNTDALNHMINKGAYNPVAALCAAETHNIVDVATIARVASAAHVDYLIWTGVQPYTPASPVVAQHISAALVRAHAQAAFPEVRALIRTAVQQLTARLDERFLPLGVITGTGWDHQLSWKAEGWLSRQLWETVGLLPETPILQTLDPGLTLGETLDLLKVL